MELGRRKQMQKEQLLKKERVTFTSLQKGRALLILLNYSEGTGKKWSAICSEIMRLVGDAATLEAPLLTRQDLEAWASGRSQLGDDKFSFVYNFLTHPESLEREEFSKANSLILSDKVRAYTKVLNELVGSECHEPIYTGEKPSKERPQIKPETFDGLFILRRRGWDALLLLSYETEINAYFCHLFLSTQGNSEKLFADASVAYLTAVDAMKEGRRSKSFDLLEYISDKDWALVRYSGLAIFGDPIRVFLRGMERKDPMVFDIFGSTKDHDNVSIMSNGLTKWIVNQDITKELARQVAQSNENQNEFLEHKNVGTHGYVLRMRPLSWWDATNMQTFIDHIKWNVGL